MSNSSQPKQALRFSCAARLNRLPATKWCWRMFAMTGLAILFAWSNYVSGLVLAQLGDIGWADTQMSAVFTAAFMSGMLVGSLLGGVVGDAIGRRKGYLLFVGFHALTMYAAAFAPTMELLVCIRAAMGLGLGALLVTLFAALSEYVPSSTRGEWLGRNSFLGNCGGPISSLIATVLTPFVTPDMNWRLMFLVPAILSSVVWVYAKNNYSESPRWLESRGLVSEADCVMDDIEQEVVNELGHPLAEPSEEDTSPVVHHRIPYRELFRGQLLKRVILGSAVLIAMNVTAYTLMTWLPTMLLLKGIDIHRSFLLYTLTVLGAPSGAFLEMIFIDRLPRKVMGPLLLAAIALAGPIFALQESTVVLCVLGFLLQLVVEMYVCYSSGVYVPEIWPTEVRLRGSGLVNSVGRASGIVTPFAVSALLTSYGLFPVFLLMSAVALLTAFIIVVMGLETRISSPVNT